MIDWILRFEFNSLLGIILYWVPLSFCAGGYTVRTWINYQKDVNTRKSEDYYSPTDTIGTLIGRALVSLLPIANLWATAFDVAPEVFKSFFKWIGSVFDIPLVPKKK